MAPVIAELRRTPDQVITRTCVTAQHREMLDQVLALFRIAPDHDLDLMQPGQSLSQLSARLFEKLAPVISYESPDWVLVQGDTTTVMAASLVAFYHRVKVGHVEAGLRTARKFDPFPEEINRRMTTVLADLHFAPTCWARDNLRRENVPVEQIIVTGNTVIDALQWVVKLPYDASRGPLASIPWRKRIILVTAHRRESFGQPLQDICGALREIAQWPDVHLVYPVHPNPNIQGPVHEALRGCPNLTLLSPLGYRPLTYLLSRSYLVLTDSGGLQEEAPSLGKPVLVLRDRTERPEAVVAGTAKVVGTETGRIVAEVRRLFEEVAEYERMAQAVNPYGDGHAAQRIASALLDD